MKLETVLHTINKYIPAINVHSLDSLGDNVVSRGGSGETVKLSLLSKSGPEYIVRIKGKTRYGRSIIYEKRHEMQYKNSTTPWLNGEYYDIEEIQPVLTLIEGAEFLENKYNLKTFINDEFINAYWEIVKDSDLTGKQYTWENRNESHVRKHIKETAFEKSVPSAENPYHQKFKPRMFFVTKF